MGKKIDRSKERLCSGKTRILSDKLKCISLKRQVTDLHNSAAILKMICGCRISSAMTTTPVQCCALLPSVTPGLASSVT